MANEAVIIELGIDGGKPVRRTVASGTTILKGTLCKLTDPNTAIAASGTGEAFAGIAAADKDGSGTDTSTDLAFYTEGVFDLKTGTPTISTGKQVCMSGANTVRECIAADLLTGAVVGTAEEDTSANEVIRVRLKGY